MQTNPTTLQLLAAVEEQLMTLKQEILTEIRNLKTIPSSKPRFVKSAEAMKMLQCSETKLNTLRNNGTLRFSQIGRTYLHDVEDIENLLKNGSPY